jgi:hypothetical protein
VEYSTTENGLDWKVAENTDYGLAKKKPASLGEAGEVSP